MDNAVPRESLNTADKIVVVEAPTEGASPVLVALREMALVLSTDVIDAGLQRYLQSHDLEPAGRTHEPFLVCLTQRANVDRMMASVTSVTEAPEAKAHKSECRQPRRNLTCVTANHNLWKLLKKMVSAEGIEPSTY